MADVTVTLYVVVIIGVTEIDCVAVLVFHCHEVASPLDSVNVEEPPLQIKTSGPALAVGSGFTVTVTELVPEQPWLDAVTVYVVVVVGVIVYKSVAGPLDH